MFAELLFLCIIIYAVCYFFNIPLMNTLMDTFGGKKVEKYTYTNSTRQRNGNRGMRKSEDLQVNITQPSATHQLSTTQQPSATHQPSATYQPSTTQQPSATYQPTTTQQPSTTQQTRGVIFNTHSEKRIISSDGSIKDTRVKTK